LDVSAGIFLDRFAEWRAVMLLRRWNGWAYVIAVAGTGAVAAVRSVTHGNLEILLASLLFIFSVLFSAILGGWKPGLLATLLCVGTSIFFFTKPYYTFRVEDTGDIVVLLTYVVGGLAISLLCEGLRSAWGRVEQRQKRLEKEIAERRRAELSEQAQAERLRVTLASIGDAVITTDAQGRVTYLNRIAESLTGWSNQEASGQPLETIFQIINEQSRKSVENPVQRALREGRVVGLANHTVLVARNHAERPIDDSAAPILDKNGAIVGVVMIFRDVSDSRRAEQVLKEADRRKDEFLATLAHELRNPLAPIRNALEVIRIAGDDQQAVCQARGTMERQLEQMIRLVDDLLDVARITRGTIELRKERVDVTTIVKNAVETSQPQFDQVGQRLRLNLPEEPIYVDADPIRMSQVFANLLNNAAKYTEPRGRIELTVQREDTNVVVSVKDNGIGIPKPKLDEIFDMFAQVDRSLERAHGGLGIGLTIVKCLVEMHGGTVEAHSEGHGRGSEFIVRQPIAVGPAQGNAPPTTEEESFPPIPSRRILVVDDNSDAASSLGMLLKLLGHDTQVAHEGEQALEIAASYQPEIVLLDIGMPKISGYDVCRRMRELPTGNDMIIVAVTGWGQEADRQKSVEATFDGHMVKPVEPLELLKLLASLQAVKS
jgi:PAS domain S-box-containing protein